MNILQIIRWSPLCLLGFTLFASPVAARVFNPGPSDASLFDVVVDARTDSDIVANFVSPASIGSDGLTTKLNLYFNTVSVGDFATVSSGTEISFGRGSSIGDSFTANPGNELIVDGGVFSGEFKAFNGGEINISGGDFVLDGEPLDGSLTIGDTITIVERNVTLSGRFANGVAFSFNLNSADSVGEDFFDPSASLKVTLEQVSLLGDSNLDGVVNFADIETFIQILCCGSYQDESDIDQSGTVDFADIPPFKAILMGN